MTRTERSLSPRAIIKDRSESKSGMDKALRKGGAGSHNWGNINDEYLIEAEALDDQQQEPVANKGEHPATLRTQLAPHQRPLQKNLLTSPSLPDAPASLPRRTVLPLKRSASALLKTVGVVVDRVPPTSPDLPPNQTGVDLASIARSSAAVSST